MKRHILLYCVVALAGAVIVSSCQRTESSSTTCTEVINVQECRNSSFADIGFDIEKVDFVPLETTEKSLLGTIQKLKEYRGHYYVLSYSQIYKFSDKGKYIGNIGRVGNGYDEYLSANAFWINNDSVYVVDGNSDRIVVYDTAGKWHRCIKNMSHMKFANDFVSVGNGDAVVCNNISFMPEVPLYFIWNPARPSDMRPVADSHYTSEGSISFGKHPMTAYDGTVYLSMPLDKMVYRYDNKTGGVDDAFELLGTNLVSGNPDNNDYMAAFADALKNGANTIIGIFRMNRFMIFNLLKGSLIWNYEISQGNLIPMKIEEDKDSAFPFVPQQIIYSDSTVCTAVFNADEFLELYRPLNSSSGLCTGISEESNPVIVKYAVKQN